MPVTYFNLATTTIPDNTTTTITFSGISASYTDLRLVFSGRGFISAGFGYHDMITRFNNDSGTNYSYSLIDSNGANNGPLQLTTQTYVPAIIHTSPSRISTNIIDIFNYAGSTWKSCLGVGGLATGSNGSLVRHYSSVWQSTSAINTITLIPGGSATYFGAGTTATLYGILKA